MSDTNVEFEYNLSSLTKVIRSGNNLTLRFRLKLDQPDPFSFHSDMLRFIIPPWHSSHFSCHPLSYGRN